MNNLASIIHCYRVKGRSNYPRVLVPGHCLLFSFRSSGTEPCVHANDLLLYHDVLDTQDSQWQKLTYLAYSKTRPVSDVDVS